MGICKIVLSEKEYRVVIKNLASMIDEYYKIKNIHQIVVIGVLAGGFMVISDITKKLVIECIVDFIKATRYGTNSRSGKKKVRIDYDIDTEIEGCHVLLIDDCFDEGLTLDFIVNFLQLRKPASINVCVLLSKPDNKNPEVKISPDWVGKKVGSEFLAGCGLDDENGINRNKPFVYVCDG